MSLLDLHVGRPVHRGALTLFPIWNGRAVGTRGYVPGGDVVQVAEREGAAVVAQLVVTNPAPRPALVLEGDLLEGGQQDRVANRSVLVAAGSAEVLEVSCVEQGRWQGGRAHRVTNRRAPMEVRAALRQDQGEVWRRVASYSDRYGHDDTGSLRHADGRAQDRATALVAGLDPLFAQCGVLVGLAGQPLLLEVVDSPRTFRQLWRPLLESVALDALHAPAAPTPGRRARRFVDRLVRTGVDVTGEAGVGRSLVGGSPYVDVRGLLWQDRAVHAVALNPRHELISA